MKSAERILGIRFSAMSSKPERVLNRIAIVSPEVQQIKHVDDTVVVEVQTSIEVGVSIGSAVGLSKREQVEYIDRSVSVAVTVQRVESVGLIVAE